MSYALEASAGPVTISQPVAVTVATLPLPAGASTSALQTQPGVDIGDVTVNNAAGAAAVNVQDGGNSLTVDGTVAVSGTVAISAAALPLPTGAATSALQLPDGHNVTVDNAAGVAAVNVQDGGNSITVDAASLPLPTGAATEATLATRLAEATFTTRIPVNGQALMAASVPVVVASNQSAIPISAASLPLPTGAATLAGQTQPGVDIGDVTVNNAAGVAAVNVQDGGNSLTIDAASLPLPAGAATSALQTQPGVDIGDVTINNAAGAAAVNIQDGGNSITVDGTVTATAAGQAADGAAVAGNPVRIAGKDGGGLTQDIITDANGVLAIGDGTAAVSIDTAMTDAESNAGNMLHVDARNVLFNGTTWDRARGDIANGLDVDVTRVTGTVTVDTELPAAAALADAAANPTAPAVGAFSMVWNGTTWDRLTGSAGNGVEVQGSVANGVTDAGNPVGQGLQARTTNPTAVTNGQRVTGKADKLGRQVVAIGQVRDLITQNNITLTTTTETTLIAAVASVFNDLVSIILSNTSATGVRVDIRDATAGTIRFSIFLAANGGGAVINPTRPYRQTTLNNNWTAQLSAAVTDVRIFAQVEQNL